MKALPVLLMVLLAASCRIDAVDQNSDLATGQPAREIPTLRDLVMEQRPQSLDAIEFRTGELFSRDWTSVTFDIFSAPDSGSMLLASKPSDQTDLVSADTTFCSFASSGDATSCLVFFDSSDSTELPIIHSIGFDDLVSNAERNEMWFHVRLDGLSGWTYTPFMSTSETQFPFPSTDALYSQQFILWQPLLDSLRMYFKPADGLFLDPLTSDSQPLADNMMFLELNLHIENDIYWFEDTPYLNGYLASPLDWESFCRQTKHPEPSVSGWIPMFNDAGNLSVSQVDLGRGYCD